MKTLYFRKDAHGAENGIRTDLFKTAFISDQKISLEIIASHKKATVIHCYEISNEKVIEKDIDFNMTELDNINEEKIKNFINSNFNCNFDEVVIVPELSEYEPRTYHDGKYTFMYSNEFILDAELIQKREDIKNMWIQKKTDNGTAVPNMCFEINKEDKNYLNITEYYFGTIKKYTVDIRNIDIQNQIC